MPALRRHSSLKGRLETGCGFRIDLRWESASQFEGSEWDTLSGTRPFGKLHPRIGAQNGTQFPLEARCGKCVPESASRTGHSFPNGPLWETVSRSGLENWDTVSAQIKEGALPASIADSAPFALSFVEVRSRGLRPLGAGCSVDGEDGARDIGGHVARQVDEGVGDVLGLAHAAERDGGDERL